MNRRRRSNRSDDSTSWIGYTDLLGNSLLILLLTVAVSALARGLNEKPPLLSLTEAESFRFSTGSYTLTSQFKAALQARLPEIRQTINKYRIDTVEIIGHTDGRPSSGTSNLDFRLPSAGTSSEMNGFNPGSNIDLGLLRAIAVANYLRSLLEQKDQPLMIRPYSAGSLIDTAGHYAPADDRDRAERRRIEVRFTRREEG